jgi:DNA-binding response OmpR family regulator
MKKILIVEDDQLVANIYRNKFSVEGFEVEVALDGATGLEVIRQFRPDAVILDLMLPKLTGVEFLRTVRAEPAFQKVPVVVFSNTYLTNMVQEAWKAGATKCLSKANCTPKQVIEIISGCFGGNGDGHAAHRVIPSHATSKLVDPVPIAQAAPSPLRTNSADRDAEFQADLRKSFLESLPATLTSLRGTLQVLIKADNEPARLKQVHELYRRIHALAGNAGVAGMVLIAQMSDALEALLKELYEKPNQINASSLRTVASAVDFLGILFEEGIVGEPHEPRPFNVLVVDDEAISRRAVAYALEKANLKSVCVEDPQMAYTLLIENKFDLVFLDVDMPGMSGFELCAKLRALPEHQKTPVVFVTTLNDFENRATSSVRGGTDLIGKPFMFIELAVKALIYVLRGRFTPGAQVATAPSA